MSRWTPSLWFPIPGAPISPSSPSGNFVGCTSTKQPNLTLLATHTDSNPCPSYHDSSILPDSSLFPFEKFSTSFRKILSIYKVDHVTPLLQTLWECPISLSMKAKFLQMNHKAPHDPATHKSELYHCSLPPLQPHVAPYSPNHIVLSFLLSAWILFPQISTWLISSPAYLYSNVTLPVRLFQAILFIITPATFRTSYFPSMHYDFTGSPRSKS